jgi:hypothetical protein
VPLTFTPYSWLISRRTGRVIPPLPGSCMTDLEGAWLSASGASARTWCALSARPASTSRSHAPGTEIAGAPTQSPGRRSAHAPAVQRAARAQRPSHARSTSITGTYKLVLTRGVHAISAEAREAILDAILHREPFVHVQVDLFGASPERRTTIITAHVVAITENPPPAEILHSSKATSFARKARNLILM